MVVMDRLFGTVPIVQVTDNPEAGVMLEKVIKETSRVTFVADKPKNVMSVFKYFFQ